ncbi:MAG: metallophosphoesterase [Thermoplasmata archaeon]
MKFAVVSDSHDNLSAIDAFVESLKGKDIELIIHCGDFVSPFTAPNFGNAKVKFLGVFGNNDGDHDFLRTRYSKIGGELLGEFAVVNISDKKAAVLHGTKEEIVSALVECGKYDFVLRGHTHTPTIEKKGKTYHINPGALSGYLANKRSYAIVDTEKMDAKLVEF